WFSYYVLLSYCCFFVRGSRKLPRSRAIPSLLRDVWLARLAGLSKINCEALEKWPQRGLPGAGSTAAAVRSSSCHFATCSPEAASQALLVRSPAPVTIRVT